MKTPAIGSVFLSANNRVSLPETPFVVRIEPRDLFIAVALYAAMVNGEPEDYAHNSKVAIKSADAVMKERNQ